MHIFFRELKAHRISLVIWAAALVAFLLLSMVKYETLSADPKALQALMSQFPATIQAIFGMNGLDITTVEGYYGILFLYLALLLAVQAGLMGVGLLAKEEEDKTTEFLYVKPFSRARILGEKIGAGLIVLIFINLVVFVSSLISCAQYLSSSTILGQLLVATAVALGLIQLVFFAIGLCIAAVIRLPKKAGTIVAGAVFASYMLYVIINLLPALDWLQTLSIFSYFEVKTFIVSQQFDSWKIAVCIVVVLTCLVTAFIAYQKRDLRT